MNDEELNKRWDSIEKGYDDLITDIKDTFYAIYLAGGIVATLVIGYLLFILISHMMYN